MFHCGVPEKGKNGQVDVWISVKLCMKAWWLRQGSWHRIRWTAASQDWKIRPASREGSGSRYHLRRIKIQIFQPGQVRETCTDPICTMSKIRTSAWQKPAFLFASNSFAAKYLHCINADWAPVGVEQLYSVVNEGQFGGSPGFTSPPVAVPWSHCGSSQRTEDAESSSVVQEDVWSTQSQFFPVRYSHTAYHRILLEFLASQMSAEWWKGGKRNGGKLFKRRWINS